MSDSKDQRICKICKKLNEAKVASCSFCGEKMPESIELVISYSHEDADDMKALATHLTALKRTRLITFWYDKDIAAGRDWDLAIRNHFETADVILLLVTPHFIASEFCYSNEMAWALKRHQNHEACVIPVIFRPTEWDEAPFHSLQALPNDGKPVTTWPDQDQALLKVIQGIKSAVIERYKM